MASDSHFRAVLWRTTTPDDVTSLVDDLEPRIFGQLDDDAWIHLGHGKDPTLGCERPSLAEWRERRW